MDAVISKLKAAGLCSEVLYKEMYIREDEMAGARPQPAVRPARVQGVRVLADSASRSLRMLLLPLPLLLEASTRSRPTLNAIRPPPPS